MPYADPEKQKEYNRDYYRKNRERLRAAQNAYAIAHSAEAVARAKRHRAANPDVVREWKRRWKAENIEKVRAYDAWYRAQPRSKQLNADNQERRRVRKLRGTPVEKVDRFRVWLIGCGRCGICGDFVDIDEMHVDHITPLVRGGEHTYDNLQPAHAFCNLSKGG